MKKIHITIIGILTFAVFGCVKEDASVTSPVSGTVKVRLSTVAPPEILGPETRTVLDEEDLSVSWQADDKIVMYNKEAENIDLVNVAGDGPLGIFEGTIPAAWLKYKDKREVVLYPAEIAKWSKGVSYVSSGAGVKNLTYPAVQPLYPGSFAPGYNLSAAVFELSGDNNPLQFRNLCGLLKVSLSGNTTVRSIAITTPGVVAATFDIKLAESTGMFDILNKTNSSSTVTMTSEEGIALGTEKKDFYACVLPYTETGEYTIVVETLEGKTLTERMLMSDAIAAGELVELADLVVNYTYEDAGGTVVDIDPTGVESVSFNYLGEAPTVSGNPDWLAVDVKDGRITFNAGAYFGSKARSCDVTVAGEKTVTITFSQAPAVAFEQVSLNFAGEAGYRDLVKSDALPEGYTVGDSGCGWITAEVTETGVSVAVKENDEGKKRTGSFDVKLGDTVVSTIEVIQMPVYNYAIFIGEYEIIHRDKTGKVNEKCTLVVNPAVAEGEEGYGERYTATLTSDVFKYPIELVFNKDSKEVPISLVCPQTIKKNGANNNIAYMWVHVAKKAPDGFTLKKDFGSGSGDYKAIDVTDEGVGYDLTLDDSDGNLNLLFVPNARAVELYPEGLEGLWFPGNRSNDDGTYDIIRDWLRPLSGQEYLKITRKW